MSTNPNAITIPLFPCRSIEEQLDFYQALGFEVTYRQAKPNLYACVRHRIMDLHFFVIKQLEPANSYSMCYVSVPDVDAVYKEWVESLKRAYGKVPSKGFPRVGKLNNLSEDRRFNLVDPAGNRLLIGQKLAPSPTPSDAAPPSKFASKFESAYRLAYSKDDPAAAARVLDLVLPQAEEATALRRYKAFVLRADIAATMEEFDLARSWTEAAEACPLSDQELEEATEETARLEELKEHLR